MSFRVALVVPDYRYEWDDPRQCNVEQLRLACRRGEIDLVVYPEDYEGADRDSLDEVIDDWASYFDVPTLIGIGTQDGFQTAVYKHPNPSHGDTTRHLYVKHSTSEKLAFDWPDYARAGVDMFKPIVLKGRRLGVHICHDMFFGLVGQRLLANGADVLIDLTGGGVNLRKWTNVVRARSLESDVPFLCTMAKREGESGHARALAFKTGDPLLPIEVTTGAAGFGGYEVFDLDLPPATSADAEQQESTSKKYTDIKIALGNVVEHADLGVKLNASAVAISCRAPLPSIGVWQAFKVKRGRVGVLPLPLSSLQDGLAIHRQDAPRDAFDHHVVLYSSNTPPESPAATMALMKLRAIEHRVAVAVLAGSWVEVVKTNRYKNIQRFQPSLGVFGLNAEFLGGTRSTAGTSPTLGIPERFFSSYLALASADS